MEACGSVTPLPKVKQVLDPKKELRPISLTSSLWKIAEDFVVNDYIKPAWEDVVDPNRFGNTSGSSTVLALIGMVHKWLEATDGNSATVQQCWYFFWLPQSFWSSLFKYYDFTESQTKPKYFGKVVDVVFFFIWWFGDYKQAKY